jgi:VanZ family protein
MASGKPLPTWFYALWFYALGTTFLMATTQRDRNKLVALLALAAVLTVALLLLQRPRTRLFIAVFNGSHVVAGATLSFAASWVMSTWWPSSTRVRRYAAAMIVTMVAGGALELAQLVGPGEASLGDLLRDLAGGVAGVVLYGAFVTRRGGLRILLLLAALVVMVPGLWPTMRTVLRHARIVRQLPAVAAFEGAGEHAEIIPMDGAELSVVAAPGAWTPADRAWTPADRARVGRVTFRAGHNNPRMLINNPFADWSDYQTLVFTVFSPEPAAFEVVLRIDDMDATVATTDRFHRRLTIAPGHNEFRIVVDDVRLSPETRELDLGALENVVLFMDQPERDHHLFVDRFWLE